MIMTVEILQAVISALSRQFGTWTAGVSSAVNLCKIVFATAGQTQAVHALLPA